MNIPILFLTELQPGEVSSVVVGGETEAPAQTTTTETTTPDTGAAAPGPSDASVTIMPIIAWVAIMAAMYFIMIRPQRKQQKDMKTLQQNIRAGDNVVTLSGLYGKVTDVGEDVFVVEFGTNRGVRIPVAKSEIASIKVPKLTPPPAPTPKE